MGVTDQDHMTISGLMMTFVMVAPPIDGAFGKDQAETGVAIKRAPGLLRGHSRRSSIQSYSLLDTVGDISGSRWHHRYRLARLYFAKPDATADSDARAVLGYEFHTGSFKRLDDLHQGVDDAAYLAVRGLHPLNSRQGKTRHFGKLSLIDTEKGTGRTHLGRCDHTGRSFRGRT